jgi:hypothetical protein
VFVVIFTSITSNIVYYKSSISEKLLSLLLCRINYDCKNILWDWLQVSVLNNFFMDIINFIL